MQLGMIGLGRMGGNMVRRLLRAGHRCVVHDRTRVGDGARLEHCLVGENADIRAGARIPPGTIIGDGMVVC